MADRGDYSIVEVIDAKNRISKLPTVQQRTEWDAFTKLHPGDHTRVLLGRSTDGSSVLELKDPEGRDRLVMRVGADGTPTLKLLDEHGVVTSELPRIKPKSSKDAGR